MDVIERAIQPGQTASQLSQIVWGIVVTSLVFIIPCGLFYFFIFYNTTLAFIDGVYLFMTIYLIGATATLMYYRFIVLNKLDGISENDNKIDIDQMSLGQVSIVFGKCFAAFFGILGFTMLATALNPSLIKIFENTLGFAVCKWMGAGATLRQMLTSKLFDSIHMSQEDAAQYMNYDFLLTTWSIENVAELEEKIKLACKTGGNSGRDLRFDFAWNTDVITQEKVQELREFIEMKYYVGHFTWIYIGSLFSLLTSIISVIMTAK